MCHHNHMDHYFGAHVKNIRVQSVVNIKGSVNSFFILTHRRNIISIIVTRSKTENADSS